MGEAGGRVGSESPGTGPSTDLVTALTSAGNFEDTKGREFTDADFDALLSQVMAGKIGVGRRTAKRAVLTASVARELHGQGLDRARATGKRLLVDGAGARSELQGDDGSGSGYPVRDRTTIISVVARAVFETRPADGGVFGFWRR